MQNMPNISTTEVLVVCTAVLLFSVVPAVLQWSDQRRRRRLAAQQARVALAAEAAAAERPSAVESPAESAELNIENVEPLAARRGPDDTSGGMVSAAEDTPAAPLASAAAVLAAPAAEPPLQELRGAESASPETGRYPLQLRDLRRVRLRDWPPAAVRDDPERNRVWEEAQRAAEEKQAVIGSTPLSSPFAAQSACLGSAEEHDSTLQLRFLLFPVLWPVSEEQAAAEAVFEIDRVSGEIHGHIRARG